MRNAGIIAGSVVLGIIGVAVAGFLTYTGVKYYKSKKNGQQKKTKKNEGGAVELRKYSLFFKWRINHYCFQEKYVPLYVTLYTNFIQQI